MRLRVLDRGHTLSVKAMFVLIRLMSGFRAPDVVKTLTYRREFFGGRMRNLFQVTLRGQSAWSIGDRELMAAFVSRTNACEF